jgi:PEP-CTERM motif
MKTFSVVIAAALAFSALAGASQAAPITYIFSGVGSGSLDGTAFTDADFTVTLVGDTGDVTSGGGELMNDATSAIFTLGAQSATLTGVGNDVVLDTSPSFPIIVFGQSQSAAPFGVAEGLSNSAFPSYNLASAFPLTSGAPAFDAKPQVFETSDGALEFDSASSMSFQAITAAPEPATWTLMLLGIGGLGMALRMQGRSKLSPSPS